MARKYSSEYKNLQPYVVEDIRKVVNATGAAGTSGGTLEQHGLNSWYHTGELAQSQASWAATKVELSNHAALPDVHHAKVHGITDAANHSVTGSQYQIVGLTAVNTLGLLTPSATPAANAVVKTDGSSGVTLVDLTVTSDLFMSGYLDFGTDVMYEDASYLQVTGSKAVRFSQNIGNAAWTIYNAGGASFGGSVDITNGGDLTVAGSGAYAGNQVLFADSSGGNVGIMMAPDSQFALDINGPARATYWIGPHAIQVKDAIMICHYDGRQPFNTNFSGEPNGHMGQVAAVTGGVIFPQGKFGKAVQVAKATTNYFLDPSCEYDATLTQWSKYASGGTFTAARSSDVVALYGSYTGKLVTSGGTGVLYRALNMNATTIAITAYVRKADKSAVTSSDCAIHYDADKTSTYTALGVDGWYRVTWVGTGTGTSVWTGLRVLAGKTLYVDGLQVEYSNASPFCDGSLGDGHTWSGTAHASTSSRTAAALTYTLSTIALDAPLTIMGWINLHSTTAENYQYLWFATSDNYSAYRNSSGTLFVGTVNCGTMPAGWVHVAFVTTGGTGVTAYVNGVSVGTAFITRSSLATFNIGHYSGSYACNGLIDDFAIIGRELPAAEIRSIYESNAPIFAETSTFSFRPTPKGLIWADDEGLWMRDTAGKPVLGVYGGEAATKNWGGFNLVPGDLLLGNNAVGSSAIWWSRVNGTFGFYGAGSGTPQVEIATDGSLTAGAGNVALNAAGAYIITGSTPDNFLQAFSFKTAHAGAVVSSFQGYVDGSANDHGGIRVGRLSSGHDADVFVLANSLAGDISTGTFGSVNTSGSNYRSLIVTRADGSTANVQTYIDANVVATIDAKGINGKTIYSSGDSGGVASTVAITNDVQGTGAGTGTIKMNGATSRNSSGWLKIWYGTNAYYVPLFSTVTG